MKFNEINKRYTELVTEYLNKGYHINAGTMAGSQGEGRDGEKWYGTKEEAEVQYEKMINRYRSRNEDDRRTLPEKAAAIVLPYVKKQPKCRSIKTSDISVYKKDTNYYISAKGHHFRLA